MWLVCVLAVGIVAHRPQAQAPTTAPADALFKDLRWRNIGPANMAGRVTDIDAVEANPAVVYVAAASGGVWKSVNAGTTWEPIFTNYGTSSIGDVTVFQKDPNIVWVGTGEGCVRNSSSWGDGVYKSTDAGKTFTKMGLGETEHIARIITHPTNPDIVYVAAQGHLWGYNPERGIFKTIDGGKTWKRLAGGLPQDDRTGSGDLIMDPANPNVLYASMWERIRKPYTFESGGPNGGLYKTTNGGDTWAKLRRRTANGIGRKDWPDGLPPQRQDSDGDRRGAAQHGSEGSGPRCLSFRRRGRDVDVHESDGEPAVLLQPHLPGSE